jgi:hypothetical protein
MKTSGRARPNDQIVTSILNLVLNPGETLPGNFATTVAGSGTDFRVLGAGVNMFVADRTQLSFDYDFKFGGRDFTAHQLSGRSRHTF